MKVHPPSTFWQEAACSRAEPSPGFTAKIVLPIPKLPMDEIKAYIVKDELKEVIFKLGDLTDNDIKENTAITCRTCIQCHDILSHINILLSFLFSSQKPRTYRFLFFCYEDQMDS